MTHLWVQGAVHEVAFDQSASADSRSDRNVNESVEPLGRSPQPLAQGGTVNVRVETHRDIEGAPHGSHQIDVLPGKLGCGCYVSVLGRRAVHVDRSKRRDPDGVKSLTLSRGAEKLKYTTDGFYGRRGGKFHPVAQIMRARTHGTDELCDACFNS